MTLSVLFSSLLSVVIGGVLGSAVDANQQGRMSQFISGTESPAIALFSPNSQTTRGWRGEHAGKWLYAASHAYARTGDKKLLKKIESVADYLAAQQQANGYIGCYKEANRFYYIPKNGSYDREWDLWNYSYMLQGFVEAYKATDEKKYLDTACRMADLMYDVFITKGRSIANSGGHAGLVGLSTIDPICDLYMVKPDDKYKKLIYRCLDELENNPGLKFLTTAAGKGELKFIGDGKIYEMMRCFVGTAKAYSMFKEQTWLDACLGAWQSIKDYHLTPLGGPWGGLKLSPEVYNRDCVFEPYQISETCEVMDWMHLNYMLLKLTGDAKYANELEKTAYNALLAAQNEDGVRWIYYIKTNGGYWTGDEWSCCWSSGMIADEDLTDMVYKTDGNTIFANIITPSKVNMKLVNGQKVAFTEDAEYIHDGRASYTIKSKGDFTFAIAKPYWADSYEVKVNGNSVESRIIKGGYIAIERNWKAGDVVTLQFPCKTRKVEKVWWFSDDPRSLLVIQSRKEHYVSFAKGPLVYACEHVDSYEKKNMMQIDRKEIDAVNITGDEFTLGGETFKPVMEMRPYNTKSPYRCIWVHVADE